MECLTFVGFLYFKYC